MCLQRSLKDGSAGEGHLLKCLQQFLEKTDMAFAQLIYDKCEMINGDLNNDSDSAEFLVALLAAMKEDFPLFGDLFASRVIGDGLCGVCESTVEASHVSTVFVVPPTAFGTVLSFSEAFGLSVEDVQGNIVLSQPCPLCKSVCYNRPFPVCLFVIMIVCGVFNRKALLFCVVEERFQVKLLHCVCQILGIVV